VVQRCVICAGPCSGGELLSNGTMYHARCHESLRELQLRLEDQIDFGNREAAVITKRIEWEQGLFGRLWRFLAGGESELPRLQKHLAEVNIITIRASETRAQSVAVLTSLYDAWLTYPPDWEARRAAVLSRSATCAQCRRWSRSLHVHHRIPISRGGSHRATNLIVLCETCHSDQHGSRTFQYDMAPKIGAFSQRIALLEQAIQERKAVHFRYRKWTGEMSTRTVDPSAFKVVGESLCVVGYCHLRNAERTFAVKRMSGVNLVPTQTAQR